MPDYLKGKKDCPFCHKNDALEVLPDRAEEDGRIYSYHVHCLHCGCNGRNRYPIGWCETPEAAMEAWQDRGPIENGEEEQIDFRIDGGEFPNMLTIAVPKEWFDAHKIQIGRKGKAILSGIERR